MTHDDLRWCQFWRCPWLHAHPQWRDTYDWLEPMRSVSLQHFAIIADQLNLPVAPILSPQIHWLNFSELERRKVCVLLAETLAPGCGRLELDEGSRLWCARTSAALRLNLAVPRHDPEQLGMHALQQWLPDYWPRLKWLFPILDESQNTPIDIAEKPLNTICQAVLWKVSDDVSH